MFSSNTKKTNKYKENRINKKKSNLLYIDQLIMKIAFLPKLRFFNIDCLIYLLTIKFYLTS